MSRIAYRIVRLDNLLAKQWVTRSLGVREDQVLPELLALVVCHCEDFAHLEGLAIRDTQKARTRMFVLQVYD